MRRKSLWFRLLVAIGCLLIAVPALAQDVGATIKGTVLDPDGLTVPQAEIKLTSEALVNSRVGLSDLDGKFIFAGLPPGDYELEVTPIGPSLEDALNRTHPGLDPWYSEPFRLVQGMTFTLEVVLPTTGSTQITVIGATPVVDVENTQTGFTFDAEFMKDIPVGRDYLGVQAITPGVVGGGNSNVRGAFSSSNQFYIDGVNVTDPLTNTFSTNMNYDAIEAIQVITGAMDAEYGRSLGGAINVVTKSGGNQFEGFFNATYQHPSMILGKKLPGDSNNTDLEQQVVANLGGPIVKDKLWFFGSFQADRLVRTTAVDGEEVGRDLNEFPMPQRDWRSMYLFGKLTFQPHDDHILKAHAQADPTWIDNVDQSVYTLPSGEQVQNQSGWLAQATHEWFPSDKVLVKSQAYFQKSVINFFPILWQDCDEFDDRGYCTEDFGGQTYDFDGSTIPENGWLGNGANDFSAGEFPYASFNRRYRSSVYSNGTFWFDALGEHEAKVGAQFETMSSYYIYPGLENGIPYYSYDESLDSEGIGPTNLDAYTPVILYQYDNNWESRFTGNFVSWYVQDVYKPIDRLTLRPGLRFDYTDLRNDVKESVFSRLTVAPRFGMAFDLSNKGRTILRAHYGRFYDSGFLVVADLLRTKSAGFSGYGWDERQEDWDYDNPQFSVSDTFLRHDDLRNPYSDEFNVGITQQIGDNFALDATFVYEYASNFWEDDEVNLIWNDDGSQVVGFRNGENTAYYRLRTPDDVYTRYTSLELTLRKGYGNNWNFIASYVFSRAEGTNSADQATGVLDIPEQNQFTRGLLDHDVTHAVKTAGSYTKPDVFTFGRSQVGYVVGWNFSMRSGLTYRQLVYNDYYADFTNYNSENDGRYRLPAVSRTDLRAGLQFQFRKSKFFGGIEMSNVFNDRTITSVNELYDPEATGEDQTFGSVLDRQSRRALSVVLRGEF